MKNFKNSLHFLLTIASVLGFLGGWATLAHSRKPVQTTNAQPQALEPLAPLAPLPAIGSNSTNITNNNNTSGFSIFTPSTTTRRSRARSLFSTGGS